ncbi:hypothetical protein [Streptomyces violaceus]|uniref:Restriction endonuclease domain-containing protein n=1 Tax=Streptomyces violaceus TaxID=1936 RepID=A0ABY9TZN1_STRVL|nr:hypothetical protein [Streptomyces janthinus]WND15872.1 hypothetical protein RI060_00075 [Streptomyces janthinus]
MLVFDLQDRPFMALEAQLSPMTPQDARMRTDRYAVDGVAVCWVAMEKRPWGRGVPSLRVAPPRNRGDAWTVRYGMGATPGPRPHGEDESGVDPHQLLLDDAIRWILQGRVHPHSDADGTVWWTAHHYVQLAVDRARLEADAEVIRQEASAERRRQAAQQRAAAAEQRRLAAQDRRLAAAEKAQEEQHAEQEQLAAFFEHAGIKAALCPRSCSWSAPPPARPSHAATRAPSMATGCSSTAGRARVPRSAGPA